jgi:Rod binding domain-containing protein
MDAISAISSGSSRELGVMGAAMEKRAGGAFDASLKEAMARRGEDRTSGKDPREAAEELVAMTLVQPILAQLRDSSMAAEPFAPTEGEKRFGAMYDAQVARQIVRGSRFPLVEELARQMRERLGPTEDPDDAQRDDGEKPKPIDLSA